MKTRLLSFQKSLLSIIENNRSGHLYRYQSHNATIKTILSKSIPQSEMPNQTHFKKGISVGGGRGEIFFTRYKNLHNKGIHGIGTDVRFRFKADKLSNNNQLKPTQEPQGGKFGDEMEDTLFLPKGKRALNNVNKFVDEITLIEPSMDDYGIDKYSKYFKFTNMHEFIEGFKQFVKSKGWSAEVNIVGLIPEPDNFFGVEL